MDHEEKDSNLLAARIKKCYDMCYYYDLPKKEQLTNK